MCLPVFLGGCKRLLVLDGATYLTRLWCIVELFTYIAMGGTQDTVDMRLLAADDQESDKLLANMRDFDARNAKCFVKEDTDRLHETIEKGFGSFNEFNKEVKGMLNGAAVVESDNSEPRVSRRVSLVATGKRDR